MAVSANSYFSNSIIGVPQVGADIDIYDTGSNPKYVLGFGFERSDGNKYRYCHFGALSARSSVVATDNIESSTTSTAMSAQVLSPTLYKIAGKTLNPNATNSDYIQINNTGANLSVAQLTADVWAGGYLTVVAGSGSGYTYRISGNSASGSPATGETYIYLYDKLAGPIDTTSAFIVQGCKWANLEPALTTTYNIAKPIGITITGQTAGNYGWVCTKGITGAVISTVPSGAAYNVMVGVSTNTAGSVSPLGVSTGNNYQIVGTIAQTYSNTTYCLVDLCLE